jgi:hypothetical protein
MAFADRLKVIRQIEEIRGSRVICYLTSLRPNVPAPLEVDAVREVFDHLLALPERPVDKLDLYLCSNGGDGTVPWRLVPVIRQFSRHFAVLVPYHAYSAATILALGANEILMHPFGVLGPIDPTVANEFNPQIPPNSGRYVGISVEDVKSYINFVKETVGIKHEDELVRMMELLGSQIHPLALGNVERFLAQSRMTARKLLKLHMDESVSERDIEDIIEGLASKLYFHGHPINRLEAGRELRLKIARDVPPALESLMWQLYLDYEGEFRNLEPFHPFVELAAAVAPAPLPPPGQPPQPTMAQQTHELPLAIVESGSSSCVKKLKKRFTLIQVQPGQNDRREETLAIEWSRTPAPRPSGGSATPAPP